MCATVNPRRDSNYIGPGDRRCDADNRFGTRCPKRAGKEAHSDGLYYCAFHGDNAKKTRCRKCGRVCLKDYDLCGLCGGPCRKRRRYPSVNFAGHKHNLVLHLDKGLIKREEKKLAKLTDPIDVSMNTLRKSVAILNLAIEDFEAVRAGEVEKNGQVVEADREDIIFVSEMVEKSSRAAERTLNMMAKKALTDKELKAAHDRVFRIIKEVINTWVPAAMRADALEYTKKELRA